MRKWKVSWKRDGCHDGKPICVRCDEKLNEEDVKDVVRWCYFLSPKVVIRVEKVVE